MIVGTEVRAFRLRLRTPLETGAGRIESRAGVLVVLRDDAGRRGFGEAAPLPGHPAFSREDGPRCADTLREAVASLVGLAPLDGWREAQARLPVDLPASRFGLETALADLAARARGLRLADWLAGGPARDRVAVNALVAGGDADAVRAAAVAAARSGFGTFKLKVGFASPSEDAKRVDALRQAVGPEARIRLDANGAWSPEMARDALRELSRFDLEYVEDPLSVRAPDDVEALASLRGLSPVPLAADDCLWDPACASAILECRAVNRFVLKAAPLGGLAAAGELARRARERGIDSVVSSTLDTAVGLTASLHLAAALEAESACGLGTAEWLAEDVATPPGVDAGQMSLPRGPGLGLDVPERADG